MRGEDIFQESLFTTIQLESFITSDYPLRPIRILLDQAMQNLNWLFDSIYAERGSESIPPERLIRAQLLQVLFRILSERQLVEQLNFNLLYRWFVGLTIAASVWDHFSFSNNRDRLAALHVLVEIFRCCRPHQLAGRELFPMSKLITPTNIPG